MDTVNRENWEVYCNKAVNALTVFKFAHGFREVPHLHCAGTQGKLAVRQGQPRPLPFFLLSFASRLTTAVTS